MYEIYLALLLFGSNGACHAEVKCLKDSTQCEWETRGDCPLTLDVCLNDTGLVTSEGYFPVTKCSNKPQPKSGDVNMVQQQRGKK